MTTGMEKKSGGKEMKSGKRKRKKSGFLESTHLSCFASAIAKIALESRHFQSTATRKERGGNERKKRKGKSAGKEMTAGKEKKSGDKE